MEKPLKVFDEILEKLNSNNIYPIIYGSLGLYLKLETIGKVEDIDFILDKPETFPICKEILAAIGFQTDTDHERELIRDNFYVSFIDKKDIEKLISEPLELNFVSLNFGKFFNINILQYRKIYNEGLKNIYRKEKKGKDDLEKIEQIDNYIQLTKY